MPGSARSELSLLLVTGGAQLQRVGDGASLRARLHQRQGHRPAGVPAYVCVPVQSVLQAGGRDTPGRTPFLRTLAWCVGAKLSCVCRGAFVSRRRWGACEGAASESLRHEAGGQNGDTKGEQVQRLNHFVWLSNGGGGRRGFHRGRTKNERERGAATAA